MVFKSIISAASACLVIVSFNANAIVIGVGGLNSTSSIVSFLNANGHTATNLGSSLSNTAGAYDFFDVVVLTRGTGTSELRDWIFGGGALVTEWNATWALNTANLLNATDSGHPPSRASDPVSITSDGLALNLGVGMSNPYLDPGSTDHYRYLTGLGTGVDILAEWSSDATPLIIGGKTGLGYSLINTLDWADGFTSNTQSSQMLLNMVSTANAQVSAVPEPSIVWLLASGLALIGFTRRKT